MAYKEFETILERFLRHEANEQEVKQLTEWFRQSEKQQELFDLYLDRWNEASTIIDNDIQKRMLEHLRAEIKQVPTPKTAAFSLRKWARTAAAISIPFIMGVGAIHFYQQSAKQQEALLTTVKSGLGDKASVTLPDGTNVWLNENSTLSYGGDYNKEERKVKLSGEAYFEVAKNREKPFTVEAEKISVKALGTEFNVKAYASESNVTTTLLEGKVCVRDNNHETILHPNEKVVVNKLNRLWMKSRTFNAEYVQMWRNNEMAFDGETLESIAGALERAYNVKIRFANDQLKQLKFTGKIDKKQPIEATLCLIAFSSPIDYKFTNGAIELTENSKERPLFNQKSNLSDKTKADN